VEIIEPNGPVPPAVDRFSVMCPPVQLIGPLGGATVLRVTTGFGVGLAVGAADGVTLGVVGDETVGGGAARCSLWVRVAPPGEHAAAVARTAIAAIMYLNVVGVRGTGTAPGDRKGNS
jgi:hypothetical protein